jgi:hypothetical protein
MPGLGVELAGSSVFARDWHPGRKTSNNINQNNLADGFFMLPLLNSIV